MWLHVRGERFQGFADGLQGLDDGLNGLKGVPIVGLEPSECLTFWDEACDLMQDEALCEQRQLIAQQVYTLEEFILAQTEAGRLNRRVKGARVLRYPYMADAPCEPT